METRGVARLPTGWLIPQLSESMMNVSKSGFSSDTSASTKSSMVGRLCSIPVQHRRDRDQRGRDSLQTPAGFRGF